MNLSPLERIIVSLAYHATLGGRRVSDKDVKALIELSGINGESTTKEHIDMHVEYGSTLGLEAKKTEESKQRAKKEGEDPWLKREKLGGRPQVPEMTTDLLPPPLAQWIYDVAARACLPMEMVAIPAIVGASSLIGTSATIQPEPNSSWCAVPNLWGAIVARPGMMKSHAVKAGIFAVKNLANEASDDFKEETKQTIGRKIALESQFSALKKNPKADPYEIENLHQEIEALNITERRYITSDPTVEKLGELMIENPRGILLVRDELSGWLMSMNKNNRQGDREFYIESWDGDTSYPVDRIIRGSKTIPSLCLSVIGSIQPGKLESHIMGAVSGGQFDDGLLQRLQLLVWPDKVPEWNRCDGVPNERAKRDAEAVFRDIDAMCREKWNEPAVFSSDAQGIYYKFRDVIEERTRGDELLKADSFGSHIGKYRGLMCQLALIFSLIDGKTPKDDIGVYETELAKDWCDYLEGHARKLYSAEIDAGPTGAMKLAKKIRDGFVTDGMTIRNIYRAGWSGLSSSDEVSDAIDELVKCNWARREQVRDGPGRSSVVLRLHPELREGK